MMSVLRAARLLPAALAFVVFAACSETAPEQVATKDIEIENVFAASPGGSASFSRGAAAAAVAISKVRLTVYSTSTGEVLFAETYTVDPNAASWTLPFSAPLGETIRIVAELISTTSGSDKVEYSGQSGPILMTPCTTACEPIPIETFPGPPENLGATSVVVSPDAPSVTEGSTVNLTATVAPTGNYQVIWRSLNEAVATVSAQGVVTGVSGGSAMIEAAVGSKADTVTVTVAALNTCVDIAYTIGATANGSWTTSDCLAASGSGRRIDNYVVTLTQQTSFTVQLSGPNGRRIVVRRAGTVDYVQLMAAAEFMPPATNPLVIGYVLPAGSYVLEVAPPDANTLGAYTLTTTVGLPTGCSSLNFIWPSVTVSGTISSTDCTGPGGGREDRFLYLPDAGVRVAAAVTTTAFAPGVFFRDAQLGPTSPLLSYDRQVEIGEPAKLAYTTTFSGFHEVIVSPSNASGSGAYTLTFGTESATNTCSAIASDLASKLAVWEATDCAEGGRLYDKYSFTTDEQTAFSVTLAGNAATKSAGVYRNGVEVLDWQNSTTANLGAAWLLEPGTYEFRVGAPSSAAGTSYTLTAADITQVGCSNNGTSGNVTLSGQTLVAGDCSIFNRYEDRLVLYVAAGKDIEVTMNATNFAPTAIIRDPLSAPGTTLKLETRTTAGTVTATHRTTVAGYYQVIFSSNQENATGNYSGSIIIR